VSSPQRDWWLRTPLVLQAPRAVFDALRDESDDEAAARSEPVLLVVILAGIAAVLSSSAAAHLLDDPVDDGLLVGVWAFLGGAIYGVVAYWLAGALLLFGLTALGSRGSFRRSRHIVAFAAVPVALSLVVWLPRLALYGGDSFRFDGADTGTGGAVFGWIQVAFALWALALLVAGVRTVERWSWPRAAGAVAIAGFLPALVALAASGVF
jgi:hypothetical protein